MTKIEGIIFDWAGTAVDFGCFAPVQVFVKIFEDEGIDVTIEEAREPMGMLKRDHIKAMLKMERIATEWKKEKGSTHTEADIDRMYDNFEQALMKTLNQYTDPIPNVVEVVNQLKDEGYKIGSTTGYTRSMMDVVILEAKNKGYSVDHVVTAEDVGHYGRPYPYMIFENMRTLEIESVKNLVKVGDTASDMEEAINAGVTAIGVIKGSSIVGLDEEEWDALTNDEKNEYIQKAKEKFLKHGATHVIEDITELPNLINGLNN